MNARILNPAEYRVIRSFPDGGSGHVDLVESEIFGREAVRKYIDPFGLEDSIPYQEPRLLDEIRHPRIVPVKGARFDEMYGTPVVVFDMPYYEEGSVYTALCDRHAFSLLDAVRISIDVLDALQYVHEQLGYVHRDLKPANVLLTVGRSRGVLADFGSAARMANGSVRALGGSLIYRAPEYCSGQLDPRSDVYDVGLITHEMVSGAFAYGSYDPKVLEARLDRGLRAMSEAELTPAPHVPRSLVRAIRRATHRDPERRYQSAAKFRTALTALRLIDWRPIPGGWEGKDSGSPRQYRVMRVKLADRRTRLQALRNIAPGAAWRRYGVADAVVPADDNEALRDYFEAVLRAAFSR